MTAEEPCFWTCEDDAEHLTHEDMDEAIELALSFCLHPKMTMSDVIVGIPQPKMSPDEVLAALPQEIEVYGYARDELPSAQQRKAWAASLVEQMMEWVDDEYGDPDGRTEHETEPACVDIALEMVDKALEGYTVWRCHKVCTKTVDVQAWAKEHRPDWLEEIS